MMKKILLAGAAFAALATSAQAADLAAPRMPIAAAVMAPSFSWTGFYIGAHAGYGWSSQRYVDPTPATFAIDSRGFFGGIQAGYNWQINQVVLGLEADISAGAINRTFGDPAVLAYRASVPMLSSVRLRAGFAADRALFYVTGGLGIATNRVTEFVAGVNTGSVSETRAGYAVGGGVEYAFTPNWTAKIEYMYYGFGDRRDIFVAGDRYSSNIHTVKLGINYLFSTGPSAVSARY